MAEDLAVLAAEARAAADQAEQERLGANDRACNAAAKAGQLERQIDERDRLALEAELGPPVQAPINISESTPDELAAARDAGHTIPKAVN